MKTLQLNLASARQSSALAECPPLTSSLAIRVLFFMTASLLLLSGPSAHGGQPLTVNNPSFETPFMATPPDYTHTLFGWTNLNVTTNAFIESVPSVTPAQGWNYLGMNPGTSVQQDLGVTFQPNTTYRLRVAVGNRSGFTNATSRSIYEIRANGVMVNTVTVNPSTVSSNQFAEGPALTFSTVLNPSYVGQTISVRLTATGSDANAGRSHFDNIRFDIPLRVSTTADSGPGSLRDALADADAMPGPDTITFDPALSGQTITLTSQITVQNTVSDVVTIDGSNLPGGVTISGGGSTRLFYVVTGASLALKGVTLSGGNGAGTPFTGNGGAIYNVGTTTMTRCTLSGNSAVNTGGAIFNTSGALHLTLTQCTLSGNTASLGNGGAIYSTGGCELTYCTLSGNRAGDSGGAIHSGGSLTLTKTIVAGNIAAFRRDIYKAGGTVTSTSFNLIGSNTSVLSEFPTGPRAGTDDAPLNPRLALLADNGGPTQTMALLPGSPALDAVTITTPSELTIDQRGFPRGRDGDGNSTAAPDIGAYEAQTSPVPGIGFNFEGGINGNSANPGGRLEAADVAGVPVFAQANWNNLTTATDATTHNGNYTNGPNPIKDAGGASLSPNLKLWWQAPNVWAANGTAPSSADGRLMNGYLDATNTGDGSAVTNLYSDNKAQPFFAVAGLPASLTQGGYKVLVYLPSGGTGYVSSYWLSGNEGQNPGNVSDESVLTKSVYRRDGAAFGSGDVYVRATGTSDQAASTPHANYARFDSRTESGFTVRAEEHSHRAGIAAVQVVRNEILVVTTTADENDANGTAGTGLSLREALRDAPEGGGILFDSALSGQTITLSSALGEIVITKSLTLDASTLPGGINVNGGSGTNRLFSVNSGVTVTLSALTLTGGNGTGLTSTGNGGAIYNAGVLKLNACTLYGNSASSGGAIAGIGNLTLSNCTISGNSTTSTGGAIYVFHVNGAVGDLKLFHTTISGNQTNGQGGGIYAASRDITVAYSIVAGNTAALSGGGDFFIFSSQVTAKGSNLIGDNTSVTSTFPAGALVGTAANPLSPMLAALGNYGGRTRTMPPLPGSPVIDAANGSPATTDQRGNPRPTDGDGNGSARADLGAVERLALASFSVSTNADSGPGSLRQILADAANEPGSTVVFPVPLSGPIVLSSEIVISAGIPVAVDGSGVPGGVVISGGGATRLFYVPQGASLMLKALTLTGGNSVGVGTGYGGAIYSYIGTLTLMQCTLSGNSASALGGAIDNLAGVLTLTQCTLSGNSAGSSGAIYNDSGPLTLTHCTISGNNAVNADGGIKNSGGTLTLTNSIVAGNTAPTNPDINHTGGTITPTGKNLIGNLTGSTLSAGSTVIVAANPLLSPMGNYGGPTQTMLPLTGSPALNAGNNAFIPVGITADQRGSFLPLNTTVDIGAVERGYVVTNANNTGGGSLRSAVNTVGGLSVIINFDPALNGLTINLNSTIAISQSLEINAEGLTNGITVNGGSQNFSLFSVAAGKTVAMHNLKLINGGGATFNSSGGAITNLGTLSLTRCTLSGNRVATGQSGGAISTTASSFLNLKDCTLNNNTAGAGGGAINSNGSTVNLQRCTLNANTASDVGGLGGGVRSDSTPLILQHCTVSGNSAPTGGGIYNTNGPLSLINSIVAGNTGTTGADIRNEGNTSSVLTRTGANLVQVLSNSGSAADTGPAAITSPPLLAALGNYGGPTQTMALLSGSPARNAAVGSTASSDQRGFPIYSLADVGAYEAQIGSIPSLVADEDFPSATYYFGVGMVGTLSATSSNTTLIPNANIVLGGSGGQLTFTAPPAANQNGTTTITLTDSLSGETMSFLVTITAVNDAPTLTAISNPSAILEDAGQQTINLAGISAGGGETQTLGVTATSSNPALIPNPTVTYTSPNATGSLAYTPVANASGTATITVTVNDGQASDNTVTQTFTVTVTAVNDVPTLAAISNPTAILEDAAQQTINLSGIGSGAANETQTLVVTATSDNTALIPHPTVTYTSPNAAGSLAYTPATNANGTATITVTVNDGQASNNIVTQTFTVTVTAVNDAPSFNKGANQNVAVAAGAQSIAGWASAISAGPANESAQTLSFIVTNTNNALFTVQPAVAANGTLSYTPAPGANGSTTVSVSLQDNGGTANGGVSTSAVKTFTINVFSLVVTNSNDSGAGSLRQAVITAAGTAGADTIVFSGVSGPIVLASQITIDNDVTIDASSLPSGLTVDGGSGNNRIFIVNSGKSLTLVGLTLTSGNITGNNGGAISNNGTLTLTQCTLSGNSADSGGAILNSGTLSATGCTFTTNSCTTNGGAVSNISGGSAAFTQCTFSANSHTGATQGGGAINHTNSGTSMTLTHCTLTGNTCTGSDGGGGIRNRGPLLTLSYCLIAGNSVTGGTGADVNNNSAITLTGANLIQTAIVGGTVTGPPRITGAALLGPLANNGGSTQTHALLAGSAGIGAATGSTVTEDQRGFDTVGTADLGAYEVQLGSIATTTTDEDTDTGAIAINVGTIGALSAVSSVPGLVSSFTFGGSGGSRTLVISPAANQNGSATITVTESLNNDAQTFTLNVTAVNDVPTLAAIPNPTAILEDAAQQTINLSGIGSGAANETQTLVVTATSDNTALIQNPTVTYTSPSASGSLAYTPVANASGSAVITVIVNDGQTSNNTVTQTFSITVNAVNDVPSFTAGADQTVAEDAAAQTIPGWATNISDGDAGVAQGLSFTVTNNNNALFSVQPAITSGGTLSFTPAADAYGSATVSVSLTDDTTAGGVALTSAVQTFTITINAVNDAPTLSVLVNQVTPEDTATGALAFTLGDVDTAFGTLTMTGASSNTTLVPVGNIVFGGSGASRTVTITPDANLNGSTIITLSVNDGEHTTTGSFQLTVTPVNDAPGFTVGVDLSVTDDAGPQSLPYWATKINDGDFEIPQALTFNLSNDANALFSVQPAVAADGTLTFTPAANAYGTATVSVTLSDTGSNTAPNVNTSPVQTFTITVYTLHVATTEDDGPGSLRNAIANAPAGATITFQNSLAGSSIELRDQIILTRSVILDARSVPGGVTIEGRNDRIFTVNSGQAVALKGLFLTSGNISGRGAEGGGAIYNNGSLELTLCTLAGNSAEGGGGAIFNIGTLTLVQCTLVNNSTIEGGGAIDNRGALTLTQCTLSDNSAANGGALSGGGTLTNCTLVDNTASELGGAVDVDGPVTLRHCTVVGNSTGGNFGRGGLHVGNRQVLALENSIVDRNTSGAGSADIYNLGTVNASGTNIVRTAIVNAGAFSTVTGAATIAYVDPLLAGLGSYGGPTQTMPPLYGSPAIDHASARAPQVYNDQRGAQRPLGPRPDIGAVEADIITVTTAADELDDPRILGTGLSLREAVRDVPAGGTVVFDRAVFTGATATTNTLTLTRGPLNPPRDCTLDGSTNPGGITILTLLPIVQQPQSLSVGSGTPVAFSVNVTNASGGVSYQWWKDGVALEGKNLPGYTISSAGETDEGAYDVTLGEAAALGALTLINVIKPAATGRSKPASLTVDGSPVTIRRHPAHAMLALGSSHTLSVVATGPATSALTYQWLKNDVRISGATSSSYVIPSAALADAGSYICEVKSSTAVGAPSNAAEIGVVDTRPRTVNLPTSASFNTTLSAAGYNLSFVWKRNDTVLSTTSRFFSMDSHGNIPIAAGLYTCTVTGPGGVITNGFNTQINLISNVPILETPLELPVATIGQAYYFQIPAQPSFSRPAMSFSVSGTLPTGISLNTTTGVLSGRPTVTRPAGYPLTFRATNLRGPSLDAAATLMVNALPANAVGTFAGPAERSTLNDNLGGRLDLTTTTTGLCSGSVTLGARAAIRFTNQLLLSDGANDLVLRATLSGITMADKTPLAASLEIFVLEQVARLTLTHPNGNSLIIPAWRNAWNGTTNKATAYAAYYTARLNAGTGSSVSPEGYGYASFTVSTAGALTVAGKLPDGSGLTGGTFVGANGEVLLFNLLYANRGSIVGQFNLTAITPTADNMLGGNFSWMKPGPKPPLTLLTSTDTVYKAGFGPLNVLAEGGVYVPPAKGLRVMGLLTVPNPNAKLSFTLGGLTPEFNQLLNIVNPSAAGLTNTAVITAPVTNITRLPTLTAATGLFAGSFQINGATTALHRPAPFFGQIVKIGATTRGYGYFLLPTATPKITTSPKLSGRMELGVP